jgi:hypothetical protein
MKHQYKTRLVNNTIAVKEAAESDDEGLKNPAAVEGAATVVTTVVPKKKMTKVKKRKVFVVYEVPVDEDKVDNVVKMMLTIIKGSRKATQMEN